ncbi:hypothetical protein KPC83_05850 [Collinsella sp. zg1085]|uniref:hypothetical protein n=1 Tax=Collinsella sp. zg1085 TaxID=2844380 RepID=UPI001C0D851A|nr:hypothetical protein [Collinsella sp. zg1085]QWT17361.1 hypothetical protein KPC83_05850 [Collinsella sp. zg1085]
MEQNKVLSSKQWKIVYIVAALCIALGAACMVSAWTLNGSVVPFLNRTGNYIDKQFNRGRKRNMTAAEQAQLERDMSKLVDDAVDGTFDHLFDD